MDKTTIFILTLFSCIFLLPFATAGVVHFQYKCHGNSCKIILVGDPPIEYPFDEFKLYTGDSWLAKKRSRPTRRHRKCQSCRVYKNGKLLGQNDPIAENGNDFQQ